MQKYINISVLAVFIVLATTALVSCSGGGSTNEPATGTLELSLMDSPNSYQAVYVTINEVRVHHPTDGWVTLPNLDLDLPQTINLLELVNGAMAYLGSAELETGHYEQMRLVLEDSQSRPPAGDRNILGNTHPYYNYLINSEDSEISLKVPSGGNTGIKLVGGFDIESSGATELVLDFDAHKSIVQAGNSGKWLLKPTIKVVETVSNSVSGIIEDAENNGGIEGALVRAQEYSLDAPDDADKIVAASGTVSNGSGAYFMYLPLLSPTDTPYNIVATKAGYMPACQRLSSNVSAEYTADFALTGLSEGATGTVSVSVGGLVNGDDSAIISFRQTHSLCGAIEVASVNVQNSEISDPIALPAGTYWIVASADGQETQVEETFEVDAGNIYQYAVTF